MNICNRLSTSSANSPVSMAAGNWGTISNTSSRRGREKRVNEKIKNKRTCDSIKCYFCS